MTTKTRFVCEKCDLEFDSSHECLNHEETCGEGINTFTCQCCGKDNKWEGRGIDAIVNKNRSHKLKLGLMGYGSLLDGENLELDVCDKCLVKCLDTFVIKPWERDKWGVVSCLQN